MDRILRVVFNQDASCITLASSRGYRIYSVNPFQQLVSSDAGGVAHVKLLFSTNLCALVGAGEQPSFSPRRLFLCNLQQRINISELNFVSTVLSVLLNMKRLVAVLEKKVHIFDLGAVRLLHSLDTPLNPHGLACLSSSEVNSYLLVPSSDSKGDVVVYDVLNLKIVNKIQAHESPIRQIALSFDGTLLATCSSKGTVIRVFSIPDGQKTHTFRRGTVPARIWSLAFSQDNTFLCTCSDTNTVHIFDLSLKRAESASAAAAVPSAPQSALMSSFSSLLSLGASSTKSLSSAFSAVSSMVPLLNDFVEPLRDFARITYNAIANHRNHHNRHHNHHNRHHNHHNHHNHHTITTHSTPCKLKKSSAVPIECAFAPDGSVLLATGDGYFYRYGVPADGGECRLLDEQSLHNRPSEEVGIALFDGPSTTRADIDFPLSSAPASASDTDAASFDTAAGAAAPDAYVSPASQRARSSVASVSTASVSTAAVSASASTSSSSSSSSVTADSSDDTFKALSPKHAADHGGSDSVAGGVYGGEEWDGEQHAVWHGIGSLSDSVDAGHHHPGIEIVDEIE